MEMDDSESDLISGKDQTEDFCFVDNVAQDTFGQQLNLLRRVSTWAGHFFVKSPGGVGRDDQETNYTRGAVSRQSFEPRNRLVRTIDFYRIH